jgi:hypothetical protein
MRLPGEEAGAVLAAGYRWSRQEAAHNPTGQAALAPNLSIPYHHYQSVPPSLAWSNVIRRRITGGDLQRL